MTFPINVNTNSNSVTNEQTASSNNLKKWNQEKVIDASFFEKYAFRQNGDQIVIAPSSSLNQNKFVTFRNGICDGNTIRLDLPFKDVQKLPPAQQGERMAQHLKRWLKMLRFQPVPHAEKRESVRVDITKLVNVHTQNFLEVAFPVYKENDRYFIECSHYSEFKPIPPRTIRDDINHLNDYLEIRNLHALYEMNEMSDQQPISLDISHIVTEENRAELLERYPLMKKDKDRWILPCARDERVRELNENQKYTLPPSNVWPILQVLPHELCGISINDLDLAELTEFEFYKSPFLQTAEAIEQHRDQINELASSCMRKLMLGTVSERNKALSLLRHIGKHVTDLSIRDVVHFAELFPIFYDLMPNLKTLRLLSCRITADELNCLKNFSKLETLNLKWSTLEGAKFTSLPASLIRLDCTSCKLTDDTLLSLLSGTNIQELKLYGTPITGAAFSGFPLTLKKLNCEDCSELEDKGVALLKACTQLEELNLSNTYIKGTAFSNLPTSLKRLNCHHCEILKDEKIALLKSCIHLEELDVSATSCTGEAFSALPASLKKLNCCGCEKLIDQAIGELRFCIHLEELYVANTPLRAPTFAFLSPTLKKLSCSNCYGLQDRALVGLQVLKNLEEFDVCETSLTGETFSYLPFSLKKLECEYCRQLTEKVFDGIHLLENLEDLNFQYNKVSGKKFSLLPVSLKKLDASCSGEINDDAVEGIKHCIHLQEANFEYTMVKDESLSKLPGSIKTLVWPHFGSKPTCLEWRNGRDEVFARS
jgi:uncharacterized protein YjbI with pentapeptide repeats